MAAKAKDKPEQVTWKLTSPAGNEYVVTSPADYYNLRAQGYADVDEKANADALAKAAAAATQQQAGPAEGATAAPPGAGAKG